MAPDQLKRRLGTYGRNWSTAMHSKITNQSNAPVESQHGRLVRLSANDRRRGYIGGNDGCDLLRASPLP